MDRQLAGSAKALAAQRLCVQGVTCGEDRREYDETLVSTFRVS